MALSAASARVSLARFAEMRREKGVPTQMGVFGAKMLVEIENDGPVTIVIDRD